MTELDPRKTTGLYRKVAALLKENSIDDFGTSQILRLIQEAEEFRDHPPFNAGEVMDRHQKAVARGDDFGTMGTFLDMDPNDDGQYGND
jgi:hypothetical protein